jgi:multidrug efflux pump subunit AcrB
MPHEAGVLVDDVNRRRSAGDRLIDAVRGAGRGRLRAIFLTEITPFVASSRCCSRAS